MGMSVEPSVPLCLGTSGGPWCEWKVPLVLPSNFQGNASGAHGPHAGTCGPDFSGLGFSVQELPWASPGRGSPPHLQHVFKLVDAQPQLGHAGLEELPQPVLLHQPHEHAEGLLLRHLGVWAGGSEGGQGSSRGMLVALGRALVYPGHLHLLDTDTQPPGPSTLASGKQGHCCFTEGQLEAAVSSLSRVALLGTVELTQSPQSPTGLRHLPSTPSSLLSPCPRPSGFSGENPQAP